MCGEVVAAPLSLQDTVYPILRKKSLHFCEKSKKFSHYLEKYDIMLLK